MINLVEEFNKSLQKIIDDILNKKNENENLLTNINKKITEKVDEAKLYKNEVDDAKNQISSLEEEIKVLKFDLTELNEIFGKKNLTAIIEAGNTEINSKISEKQDEITQHRKKISELTEKARSIKDLLINLKKDKILKEEKLSNYIKIYNYYNGSLTKIIDYAINNPDNLNIRDISYNYLKNKSSNGEPVSEVFEEIESIDKDLNNEKEIEPKQEDSIDNDEFLEKLKKAAFELEELEKTIDLNYQDVIDKNIDEDAAKKEIMPDEIQNEEIASEELTPVFEEVEEIKENKSQSVLEEGKRAEIKEKPQETNPISNRVNVLDANIDENEINEIKIPDIFGNNIISEAELNEGTLSINDFFKKYALDFDRFDSIKQEELNSAFSLEKFEKIIKVLSNNKIDLNNIYNASKIFTKMEPEELEKIISKLLLSGQTTTNIGYVLDSLPLISSDRLNDVIASYGPNIGDINITDLIIKAKKE